MAKVALILCMSLGTSEAFAQSSTSTSDQIWRESVEQVVDQYIRSHPEVIEQAFQALQAKRHEEERARIEQAVALHQSELLYDNATPVSGDRAGDVTVTEFFDYRCGFCKRAASAVTQLQNEDSHVRIVYKDFPILGTNSVYAAKAALASQAQGRHKSFHEALLAAKDDLTEERIVEIARDVGLDTHKLLEDIDNPELLTIIERNRVLAEVLQITGTPAFVVGNELTHGAMELAALKEIVARARKQNKAESTK